MTYEEMKKLLKSHKITLTSFCQQIDKTPDWLRVMSSRNAGDISELYRLAVIGRISEEELKKSKP